MYKISLAIKSDFPAAAEVNTPALREKISAIDTVTVLPNPEPDNTDLMPRVTGLEVLVTFISSAAAYHLARAVRDFVKRQKMSIEVHAPNGNRLIIKAEGGDTASVADVVGFLTGKHAKTSAKKEINTSTAKLKESN